MIGRVRTGCGWLYVGLLLCKTRSFQVLTGSYIIHFLISINLLAPSLYHCFPYLFLFCTYCTLTCTNLPLEMNSQQFTCLPLSIQCKLTINDINISLLIFSGELLLWDLSVASGPEQVQNFGQGHSRIVFNISCNKEGTKVISCSMDRQVYMCNLNKKNSMKIGMCQGCTTGHTFQ